MTTYHPYSIDISRAAEWLRRDMADPMSRPSEPMPEPDTEEDMLKARAAMLENELRDPFITGDEAEPTLSELAEIGDKLNAVFGSPEWFNAVDEIPF